MPISEYEKIEILKQIEKIKVDISNEIISANTLRNVKFLLADLEYLYEKND